MYLAINDGMNRSATSWASMEKMSYGWLTRHLKFFIANQCFSMISIFLSHLWFIEPEKICMWTTLWSMRFKKMEFLEFSRLHRPILIMLFVLYDKKYLIMNGELTQIYEDTCIWENWDEHCGLLDNISAENINGTAGYHN